MKTVSIILKNEKEKAYKLIIKLFVVLHAAFFLYLLSDAGSRKEGIAGLVIVALYITYKLLVANTVYDRLPFESQVFIFFAIVLMPGWVCFIDIALSLLSSFALKRAVFNFTPRSIVKRNIPTKKYTWDQFSNVILKDNILTLDFKNNKLLQAEIEPANINEEAFNTFANEQLNKN